MCKIENVFRWNRWNPIKFARVVTVTHVKTNSVLTMTIPEYFYNIWRKREKTIRDAVEIMVPLEITNDPTILEAMLLQTKHLFVENHIKNKTGHDGIGKLIAAMSDPNTEPTEEEIKALKNIMSLEDDEGSASINI
jgi:hypothetical protein